MDPHLSHVLQYHLPPQSYPYNISYTFICLAISEGKIIIIMIIIKTTTTKNSLKESLRKSCLPKCDEFHITGTANNLDVMNSLPKHYIVKDI